MIFTSTLTQEQIIDLIRAACPREATAADIQLLIALDGTVTAKTILEFATPTQAHPETPRLYMLSRKIRAAVLLIPESVEFSAARIRKEIEKEIGHPLNITDYNGVASRLHQMAKIGKDIDFVTRRGSSSGKSNTYIRVARENE